MFFFSSTDDQGINDVFSSDTAVPVSADVSSVSFFSRNIFSLVNFNICFIILGKWWRAQPEFRIGPCG